MELKKKIKDKIDPKHKGFTHTWMFKVLYGLLLLFLFAILYNFVVREDDNSQLSDEDQKRAEEESNAQLDTLDVIGDYLWPNLKHIQAKAGDDSKMPKEEVKPGVVQKSAPPVEAAAATEQDIKAATGFSGTSDANVSSSSKTITPKVEQMEAPKVQQMEAPSVQ